MKILKNKIVSKVKNNIKKVNRPIGVFDSGVGGLSVLIELKKLLPNEDFVFVADQLYVPYGEKSKTELVKLTSSITDFLIKKHDAKMVVVACNTATCGAIEELRAKYEIPIVGTVPAVKPASEKTKTKMIAVISTPSTSKSLALKKLIREYCTDMDIKTLNIGCKNLENTVEEGELHSAQVHELLQKYLKNIINSDVDHLVLGCTHYPFLKTNISQILGKKVKLVDSGRAIAVHVSNLLKKHSIKNSQKKQGKTAYFTTGNAKKFTKVAIKLLKEKVESFKIKV